MLKDYRRMLRRPAETPHSQTEAMFSEWAPNLEAELLGELYNPAQRGAFRAFLHGKQDQNLRFLAVLEEQSQRCLLPRRSHLSISIPP